MPLNLLIKNMKVNRLNFLFIFLLISSCSPKKLEPEAYAAWFENEENGMRKSKTEAGVLVISQYKNMDYILTKKGQIIEGAEISLQDLASDAGKSVLFDLFISCENGKYSPLHYRAEETEESNARYYYYHFEFIKDIYIESQTGRISPAYCITDKGSGLNNTLAFSIGFDRGPWADEDFKLVVKDEILGAGTLKFLYKKSDFNSIPQLKN